MKGTLVTGNFVHLQESLETKIAIVISKTIKAYLKRDKFVTQYKLFYKYLSRQ